MLLNSIIGNYITKEKPINNIDILSLTFDSREKKEKSMYFAINGENSNGEIFALDAVKNGAIIIVSENVTKANVPHIIVDDVRKAFSYFSANFYNNPQNNLKIIGVVGTNGKTSTCRILKNIFSFVGKKVASIGTLGVEVDNKTIITNLTTPDPIMLFEILQKLNKMGIEFVIMEVSAHAIALKKVMPINFDALIYTNCTQDHLDFFKTFEAYRETKKSILNLKNSKRLIINSDDELGREIILNYSDEVYSYGLTNPADVFAVKLKENKNGLKFVINLFDYLYEVNTKLMGLVNVYNILAATETAFLFGVETEKIGQAINSISVVEGRMEKVASYNGGDVYIDYAHTPDGLEKSLLSLRKVTRKNLICVFGCGGNRDVSKRAIMGRIAGDIADFVIVTSDNPRNENPLDIINEIAKGVKEGTNCYLLEKDRFLAIKSALKRLQSGDSLLIAGKGAETTQEIMGEKIEFSDKQTVLNLIENNV